MEIKNVLRPATLLVLALTMVLPLFAQAGGGQGRRQMSEEDIKERISRLADTLELTEDQEKQVLETELEFRRKMQAERENFDPQTSDREAMRDKMMKLRAEVDAEHKKVMTEEQYGKYRKMMDQRRSQMRRQRPQDGQGERGRGRGRGG